MSSALAIASVTAVLKSLLDNRLVEQGAPATVGDVSVTALPPDRITTGVDERSQLNLFLYRVTPNTRWRPAPPVTSNGHAEKSTVGQAEESPPAPRPLALDLHYLLTAYGEQDLHAEILLGYAMQLLQEIPILTREQIQSALTSPNGSSGVAPPARAALAAGGLADQIEQINVTPEFTGGEETSRLWSAMQARYRPSATYKVSTVLLEAYEAPAGTDREKPASRAGRR